MKRREPLTVLCVLVLAAGVGLLWPGVRSVPKPPTVRSLVPEVDLEVGAAPALLDQVYNTSDCPGVVAFFNEHPIPVPSFDAASGRRILGWRIRCEGQVVVRGGREIRNGAPGRLIYRSFGTIELNYDPFDSLAWER